MSHVIEGKVFVVGDNIDTDQIIPAQYLTLVPTIPDEYEKLGSYALCGLPDSYATRFVADGEMKTEFPIIVAGRNFGCGSSREHAPVSLGAAGTEAVVALSYARIFFRNCMATGELYPMECETDLSKVLETGQTVRLDLDASTLTVLPDGETYKLPPLGNAKEVIDQGGLFKYARNNGMMG
jgi:3-isopropylmalate/(R)-2-methylmalate dehydratase small subunit